MPGSLLEAHHIAVNTIGTGEFFKAIREDEMLVRNHGQEYWSWPQWDRFFELAEKHSMTAIDTYRSGGKDVAYMHFSHLGNALRIQWGRVRDAKNAGLSSYEFWLQEKRREAADTKRQKDIENYQSMRIKRDAEQAEKSGKRYAQPADVTF